MDSSSVFFFFFFFFFSSARSSARHTLSLARLASPAAGHPPPKKPSSYKPSTSNSLYLKLPLDNHVLAHAPALAPLVGRRRRRKQQQQWTGIVVDPEGRQVRLVVPGLPVDQRLFHGHGRGRCGVGYVGGGLGARGPGFRELGRGARGDDGRSECENESSLLFHRPFFFLTLFDPPNPLPKTDATTTEKALPSPATSLGRVDGRRSLDSVLSNTSVFGGGAGGASSISSSPISSPPGGGTLSSRASLDSARGSADVRALLWRASMPGKRVSLLPFWVCGLR